MSDALYPDLGVRIQDLFRQRFWRAAAGLCLLLFLALSRQAIGLATSRSLGGFGHQSWQSDSGLPQNTVRAILQTQDGFLWIGTEGGLVRFDGADFRIFDRSNTSALKSDVINALTQDAAGTLWIATPGGVVSERAQVFRAYSKADGLPAEDIIGLGLSGNRKVLALTSAGAAALEDDRFSTVPGTERLGLADGANLVADNGHARAWVAGPDGLANPDAQAKGSADGAGLRVGAIQALAADHAGGLWVGGAHALIHVGGVAVDFSKLNAALPSQDVTSLLVDPAGAVWIGTNSGLAVFAHGRLKAQTAFAGMHVTRLFIDREGSVWVATTDRIGRVTAKGMEFAPTAWSLSGVLSIYEDREGSMWFGTETAGLHALREQAFTSITTSEGLSASLVRAVFQDPTGAMWIGTSGGGLDRVVAQDGSATQVRAYQGSLPSSVVLALAETGSGAEADLWVGTPQGLVRIRGGASQVFTTADGLADDFVRSLYADADGSLWVGTRNGLTHLVGGRFRSYSRLDGLASDLIGAMLRSRDGTLWVGTLGGLSRMQGEGFINAPQHGAAAANGAVTALLEDSAGSLWIGTQDQGLSRLKAGTLTRFPSARTGLPATIYGMLEDEDRNLWLSSRTGVDRVAIAALDTFDPRGGSLRVSHFGAADGMRISEASGGGHPAAWSARDGSLWFATLNGVAVVHPRQALRNVVAPLVAIEEVRVSDQPVEKSAAASAESGMAPIRIAPGQGRITVQYAGLSFVAPRKVRYRYRLDGFDPGWIEAGGRRTAYYTNVPPGSYRFEVMAANNDGVWSAQPAELRFAIKPYLHQTWWFYALLACGLGGLGYAAYRWRVHTVEAQVGAQYRAVLEERGRIAREIHDTLAQGYVAASVQLELAEQLMQHSVEAARKQLRQTRELVREGLEEARSSIWNLRSQADADTLPALLAAHVSSLTLRRGVQQKEPLLKFAVHGAYRPLQRSVEDEVRRVAQEAMANAMAHARARLITVTLSYEAHMLKLQVVDDGIGFDATRSGDYAGRGHFGLQGMRERADRIGAMLEIRNTLDTAAIESDVPKQLGTAVTLQLDLQAAARKDAV